MTKKFKKSENDHGSYPTLDPHGIKCEGTICRARIPNGPEFYGLLREGIIEFNGVPYALPPTGERRFKAPIIRYYNDESATINAFEHGRKCATHQMGADQSEDCLTVNIHVSQQAIENHNYVPIVYYIHGGGYNHGSNRIELDNLVRDQG